MQSAPLRSVFRPQLTCLRDFAEIVKQQCSIGGPLSEADLRLGFTVALHRTAGIPLHCMSLESRYYEHHQLKLDLAVRAHGAYYCAAEFKMQVSERRHRRNALLVLNDLTRLAFANRAWRQGDLDCPAYFIYLRSEREARALEAHSRTLGEMLALPVGKLTDFPTEAWVDTVWNANSHKPWFKDFPLLVKDSPYPHRLICLARECLDAYTGERWELAVFSVLGDPELDRTF